MAIQIVDLLSNVRITEFFIFIQHFLWENEAVEMSNFCESRRIAKAKCNVAAVTGCFLCESEV